MTPRSINIYGKCWSRRGSAGGGVYHTVSIYVDDEHVCATPMTYGQHCAQTAREWLERAGYLPGIAAGEFLRDYCARVGCQFSFAQIDVARERDLDRPFDLVQTRRRRATRFTTVPHARCERAGRCVEHAYNNEVTPCR